MAGNHLIIIEGYNGPLMVRDTVTISIKPRPAWRNYDMSNSPLPSNKITCIAVDNEGVAWIGTNKGLVRFDGVNWTVYGDTVKDEGPYIAAIGVDNNGSVYMNGYFTLDKFKNNAWVSYPSFFQIGSLAVGTNGVVWSCSHPVLERHEDSVSTIFVAENPDLDMYPSDVTVDDKNAVWVVGQKGVASYDGTFWTRYTPDELGMSDDLGYSPIIAKGVNDTVYVVSSGNIVTFVGGTHTITTPDSKNKRYPGPRPGLIAIDSSGTKWITTGPSYNDLYEGLGRAKGVEWWSYNVGNSGLPSNTIYDMVADKNNILWICTDKGLATLNTSLDPLVAFTTDVRGDAVATPSMASVITGISPNPASSRAEITINLLNSVRVRMSILNTLGQEVLIVCDTMFDEGAGSVTLHASALSTGAYVVRMIAGDVVESRQLIINR